MSPLREWRENLWVNDQDCSGTRVHIRTGKGKISKVSYVFLRKAGSRDHLPVPAWLRSAMWVILYNPRTRNLQRATLQSLVPEVIHADA